MQKPRLYFALSTHKGEQRGMGSHLFFGKIFYFIFPQGIVLFGVGRNYSLVLSVDEAVWEGLCWLCLGYSSS